MTSTDEMDKGLPKADEPMLYKCRNCRTFLFDEKTVVNAHGEYLDGAVMTDTSELSCDAGVYYFQGDATLLPWIKLYVAEADWVKGKIGCPKCNNRLGSFDFVSGRQCQCKEFVLPPIHIVKSKVDRQVLCSSQHLQDENREIKNVNLPINS